MPEGDTIHRAAVNLRKVLNDTRIEVVEGRVEVQNKDKLLGSIVKGVEARGKHLIIHADNGFVIHSHMGMTGAWHIYPLSFPWQKSQANAFIVLTTMKWCIVCFTPKQIRIITDRELLRDAYLRQLGPDLLGPPIEEELLLRRFRSQDSVAIGIAIMNQTVVSGIGNVYKSEVLFLENIHPRTRVDQLTDEQILGIRDRALSLMKRNLSGGRRRTRFRNDSQQLWVYGRRGDECFKCGSMIEVIRQGDTARSTYFCSVCQPSATRGGAIKF